jgi:hypothetical protein
MPVFRLAAVCLIGALAAAAATPACAQSAAYSDGLGDRTTYEQWFASLGPEERDGATFWAAERSKSHPLPCAAHDDNPNTPWSAGCRAAQLRLGSADERRRSEPEYRLGWNAYKQIPSVTAPSPSALLTPQSPISALPSDQNSEASPPSSAPADDQGQTDAYAAAAQYQEALDSGWNTYRIAHMAAFGGLLDPALMLRIKNTIRDAEIHKLKIFFGSLTDDKTRYLNLASSLLEEQLGRMNAFEMSFGGVSTSDCLAIRGSRALETLK